MTIYEFVGDGSEFHSGIPARDLCEADVEQLSDAQLATVEASKLYKKPKLAKASKAKADEAEGGE